MPRWDRSLDDAESPYRQRISLGDLPVQRASDAPLDSEWALWRYIGKLVLLMLLFGIIATNAMYGLFELIAFLGE